MDEALPKLLADKNQALGVRRNAPRKQRPYREPLQERKIAAVDDDDQSLYVGKQRAEACGDQPVSQDGSRGFLAKRLSQAQHQAGGLQNASWFLPQVGPDAVAKAQILSAMRGIGDPTHTALCLALRVFWRDDLNIQTGLA